MCLVAPWRFGSGCAWWHCCHPILSHPCCPHGTLRTRPCLVALCHLRCAIPAVPKAPWWHCCHLTLSHPCCPLVTLSTRPCLVALLSPLIVPHLLSPCHSGGTAVTSYCPSLLSPCHPEHQATFGGTVVTSHCPISTVPMAPWGPDHAWWHCCHLTLCHIYCPHGTLVALLSPHMVPSLLSPWHLKDQALFGGTVSPQMCHPCCPHVTLVALCHLTLSHFCCPHVTLRTRPCLVALCHPRLCHICCPHGTLVALLSPHILPSLLSPCHPDHQSVPGGTVSPLIVPHLLSPWHLKDQALFGGTVVTSDVPCLLSPG